MNINLIRFKGVVKELQGIHTQLARIADCLEMDLANKGLYLRPPVADTSGPPPTVDYVDEELGWAKEQLDYIRKQSERDAEAEETPGVR